MRPGWSARNFRPTSTERVSRLDGLLGTAVFGQMVHGHAPTMGELVGVGVAVGGTGVGVRVGVAVLVGVGVAVGAAVPAMLSIAMLSKFVFQPLLLPSVIEEQ